MGRQIIFKVGNKDFIINLSGRKEMIRFSAPKNSLVTAIKNEIFDDMLIGNFMKTQLINISSKNNHFCAGKLGQYLIFRRKMTTFPLEYLTFRRKITVIPLENSVNT